MAKHDFPYESMDQAIQDKFSKLGTDDNKTYAFKCMKDGWVNKQYRKEQNQKNSDLLKLAKKDPRFRDAVNRDLKSKSA